jgi:hypothetical protein
MIYKSESQRSPPTLPHLIIRNINFRSWLTLSNPKLRVCKMKARSASQPPTPLGPIYRSNQKTKMPIRAKKVIIAKEGYFGPTSTASHSMPSNQSSSTSLPCDLCDDAMCMTHHCSFANFEAKLGNPSLTRFEARQAARSRRVSHTVLILPLILWHNQQTIAHLVLRPKPRNHRSDFVGPITKPQLPVLRPRLGNLMTLVLKLNQETRTSHLLVHGEDRTQCHPTYRSFHHRVPDLCLTIPGPLHHVSYSCLDPHRCPPCRTYHLHITRQVNTFLHMNR